MPIRIQKVETGRRAKTNSIFYGVTGAGKTTFLGSAQECEWTSPILIMDILGGMRSLAGMGIEITRPTSFAEIQDIYNFLRHDNRKYRSVGIDSITGLQRKLSMGEIIGELDPEGAYSNLANYTPADQYDWLGSGEQMRRFVRAFHDLAYLPDEERRLHVIITALEKHDLERGIICPSLPGVLGPEIGASVDIMARLTVQHVGIEGEEDEEDEEELERYRHLQFREQRDAQTGLRVLAKVRVPPTRTFPDEMWQPTMNKLVSVWLRTRRKKRRRRR